MYRLAMNSRRYSTYSIVERDGKNDKEGEGYERKKENIIGGSE